MATDEVCTVPRPRTKTERQCCEGQPHHNMGDATGPLARPIFVVVALESRLARPPMMGCQVPLRQTFPGDAQSLSKWHSVVQQMPERPASRCVRSAATLRPESGERRHAGWHG
jgi:hypothetical protein